MKAPGSCCHGGKAGSWWWRQHGQVSGHAGQRGGSCQPALPLPIVYGRPCTVQGLPRWVSLEGEGQGDWSLSTGQARCQAAILCKGPLLLSGSKLLVGRRALPHGRTPTMPHLLDTPSPDVRPEGWGSVPLLVPG